MRDIFEIIIFPFYDNIFQRGVERITFFKYFSVFFTLKNPGAVLLN